VRGAFGQREAVRNNEFCFESPKELFDVFIALQDFELIAVVQFQCRLQRKEMFRAVI
jgi:hypothetical protein